VKTKLIFPKQKLSHILFLYIFYFFFFLFTMLSMRIESRMLWILFKSLTTRPNLMTYFKWNLLSRLL
jgi:hypothetical protein